MVARTRRAPAIPKTLGARIDLLRKIRDEKRTLSEQLKAVDKRYAEIEALVMTSLDQADVRLGEGRSAVASITETIQPQVDDWDAIHKWIKTNSAQYLYYRRINAVPFRELLESRRGRKIPGLSSVTVRKLNLRNKDT